MNDKEFQEIKRQEQKRFEENQKYDELCNQMTTILCEIGKLATEVKNLKNSETISDLEKERIELLKKISQYIYIYNDEQLKNQVKNFKIEAETLSIINDNKILNEKLFDLRYRWKKFLKDTKEIRFKSKKFKTR